jgi:hypothetical protein
MATTPAMNGPAMTESPPMVTLCVSVRASVRRRLKVIAVRRGVPMRELVEDALSRALERLEHEETPEYARRNA